MICVRIKIEPHKDYQCLKPDVATALYDTAKRLLRVGFEVEFNVPESNGNGPEDEPMDSSEANDVFFEIQEKFEKRGQHMFMMLEPGMTGSFLDILLIFPHYTFYESFL